MPLPTSGPLSLEDIRNEFGGSPEDQLTEYYRGGLYVPDVTVNSNIPTSGIIQIDDFYGSSKTATATYEIIGGGGAGGYGLREGSGTGTSGSGGMSSIIGSVSGILVSAPGGAGGLNGAVLPLVNHDGVASAYGVGGAGGPVRLPGSAAPLTSYGAGGGGGGGDAKGFPGQAGQGGRAGVQKTGSVQVVYGEELVVIIGSGGVPSTGGKFIGGAGAGGYGKITINGVTTVFTSSSRIVVK